MYPWFLYSSIKFDPFWHFEALGGALGFLFSSEGQRRREKRAFGMEKGSLVPGAKASGTKET
jgi:hypothetical protein